MPPLSLVNSLSLRLFNQAYFHLNGRRSGRSLTYYVPFFYPLDSILEWNRIYGPRGSTSTSAWYQGASKLK